MSDQIIVIQKHWRGYAQRVRYEKLLMRNLYKFYYAPENESITPSITHDISVKSDRRENLMVTPSQQFTDPKFSGFYSSTQSDELRKQTVLIPDWQSDVSYHSTRVQPKLKRKQNLLLYSFDKYVYSAIRIQRSWRGYVSRRYFCDFYAFKSSVRQIEKAYIEYRYRSHQKMKKLLFQLETSSVNVSIMIKHFFAYQQHVIKSLGRKQNVDAFITKLNMGLITQVNEGVRQMQQLQHPNKPLKHSQNNILSAPSTDRTQKNHLKDSNPYQLQGQLGWKSQTLLKALTSRQRYPVWQE